MGVISAVAPSAPSPPSASAISARVARLSSVAMSSVGERRFCVSEHASRCVDPRASALVHT